MKNPNVKNVWIDKENLPIWKGLSRGHKSGLVNWALKNVKEYKTFLIKQLEKENEK